MAKKGFDKAIENPDFFDHEEGSGQEFNEVSGGGIDPYGNSEAKEKNSMNMNAAEAFSKADYTKIDAMGTDAAKKGKSGQFSSNKGDHFKVEDVDPSGNDAGKKQSFQTIKR